MYRNMQELKRLQAIVYVCVAGVVISLGGGIFTAYKTHKEKEAQVIPANQVPVPATAQ